MIIWISRSSNGNADVEHVFAARDEAVMDALYMYRHLTVRERQDNIISVEAYELPDIDDDNRTVASIWHDAVMDDLDGTHNPIEYLEIED